MADAKPVKRSKQPLQGRSPSGEPTGPSGGGRTPTTSVSLAPEPPTFDPRSARLIAVGIAVSILAGAVTSTVLKVTLGSSLLTVVGLYVPLYSGLWWTCTMTSRRYGTGSARSDFGLSFAWRDSYRALALFVVAGIVQRIAVLPIAGLANRTSGTIHNGAAGLPRASLLVYAFTAVLVAPALEELAFRGALLRVLNGRVGPQAAVIVQAVAFGVYHFTPWLGLATVPFMVETMVFGLCAGAVANRYGRLGPSVIAHVVNNALFVVAVARLR